MAKTILTDAFIQVNGVTLSDHANNVTITDEADEVDVTSFGASKKQILLGLGDGTIAVSFFQDFAGGSVDATLSAIKGSNTPFTVEVRPTSGARSATNPGYTMTSVLPTYTPLSGGVGDASTIDASFRNAGAAGIVRNTS